MYKRFRSNAVRRAGSQDSLRCSTVSLRRLICFSSCCISAFERGVVSEGATDVVPADDSIPELSCRETITPIDTTIVNAAAPAIICGTDRLKLSNLRLAQHRTGHDQKPGLRSST